MGIAHGKGIQHLHDIGVIKLAQRLAFAHEALQQFRVAPGHIRPQALDSDRLCRLRIKPTEYRAHAALAQDVFPPIDRFYDVPFAAGKAARNHEKSP